MQVRALRSFAGRYGHIRVGQIFSSAPSYARELQSNGLVEVIGEPKPAGNRAIPEAPKRADTPPPQPPPDDQVGKDGATASSERAPASGTGRTSSSLRQDLVSRKRTRKPSAAGATKTEDPGAR